MARTYTKKTKMNTVTSFTDFLSPEEMEFFPTLDICLPQYDEGFTDDVDDVFQLPQLPTKENVDHISTGDILQDFDLEGGNSLLETDWFDEKFDFNNFEPSVSDTDTLQELQEFTPVESPFCGTTLPEISDELLMPLAEEGQEAIPEVMPTTPEQKVPEYLAMSPYSTCSVVSPGLGSTMESNPASPYSASSVSSPESTVSLIDLLTDTSNTDKAQSTEISTTRATPYTRFPDEQTHKPKVKSPAQKQRKRVQNKDAATRYRVKKRSEQDELFQEAEIMEKANDKLKDQVAAISKEIEYLKNLMVEVCKNKQRQQAKEAN